MPKHELTRKERERERRRAEILAAARELFASKGFHNVSMQEVATSAEFSIGSLYGFFESKEDLYKAMILELTDDYHRKIDEEIASIDGAVEKLRAFLVAKAELFDEKLDLLRLYFKEAGGLSSSFREDLRQEMCSQHDRLVGNLSAVFESGIAEGLFLPVADPRLLAIAIDSLSTAAMLDRSECGHGAPLSKDPDAILNILFKGLLAS